MRFADAPRKNFKFVRLAHSFFIIYYLLSIILFLSCNNRQHNIHDHPRLYQRKRGH